MSRSSVPLFPSEVLSEVLNEVDGLAGTRGLVDANDDADRLAMLWQAHSDIFGSTQRCKEVLVLIAVGVGEFAWIPAGSGRGFFGQCVLGDLVDGAVF
jgi:hypothetical protein